MNQMSDPLNIVLARMDAKKTELAKEVIAAIDDRCRRLEAKMDDGFRQLTAKLEEIRATLEEGE